MTNWLKLIELGWKYPEKISNAGTKFKRPIKQEILFTREDLKDVIPERMNWLLKMAIHEWIYHKKVIEDIIYYYIIKSMDDDLAEIGIWRLFAESLG